VTGAIVQELKPPATQQLAQQHQQMAEQVEK
jgi:hypothetical protein